MRGTGEVVLSLYVMCLTACIVWVVVSTMILRMEER